MKAILRHNLLFFLSVGIPLTVYLLTSPHHSVAFGDSDELITAGFFFGLPHPPGYPLFNLLIYFFTHLPLPLSIAYKANLVSILSASLAIGIFYKLCQSVLSILKIKISNRIQSIIPLFLSLLLALTPLYWTYATVAEVFALDILLALSICYLSLSLHRIWNVQHWYIFSFVIGLSLVHQQKTIVIILPSLLFLINHLKKNIGHVFKGMLLIVSVVVVFYVLLFKFANQQAPQSWSVELNPQGIWGYITRQDYAAFGSSNAYFSDIFTTQNIQSFGYYLQNMISQLSFPVFLVSLIGIIVLFRLGNSKFAWYITGLFMLAGPTMGYYLTFPSYNQMPASQNLIIAITQRMYLLGLPFWILLLIFPLLYLINKFHIQSKITAIFFLIPLFLLFNNYPSQNLTNYQSIKQYATKILQNLPDSSVLVCFSDISCFSLISTQSIQKLRQDIIIIPVTPKMQSYVKTKNPELFKYYYSRNPHRIASIISLALDQGKQVFVAEISPEYVDFMGLDGKAFYLSPYDLVFEITNAPKLQTVTDAFQIDNWPLKSSLPFVIAFNATLAEQFAKNGTLYARFGQKIQASQYYTNALTLWPNNQIVTDLLSSLPKYSGDPIYLAGNQIRIDEIQNKALNCQNDKKCISYFYQLASYKQPYNLALRQQLVTLYTELNINTLAKEEQTNLNKLIKSSQK